MQNILAAAGIGAALIAATVAGTANAFVGDAHEAGFSNPRGDAALSSDGVGVCTSFESGFRSR
jgi:hypothetical protein